MVNQWRGATVADLISDYGRAYLPADDTTRRACNQAWFEHIYLDREGPGVVSVSPERTEVVEASRRPRCAHLLSVRRLDRAPGRGNRMDAAPVGTASIRSHMV